MGKIKIKGIKKPKPVKDPDAPKITTFGEEIVSHLKTIEDEYEEYIKMKDNITEILTKPTKAQPGDDWRKKKFMFISMSPYCKKGMGQLMPAEFASAVWSLDRGLFDGHTALFDPGAVPYGRRFEVMRNCSAYGLPVPGRFEKAFPGTNAQEFYQQMIDVAEKYGLYLEDEIEVDINMDDLRLDDEEPEEDEQKEKTEKKILMFSTKGDSAMLKCCFKWLDAQMEKAGRAAPKVKIYWHETLLMVMSGMEGKPGEAKKGAIFHEGGAAKYIYHPRYDFYWITSCKWHQREDHGGDVSMCANNICLRRVFNALYYLCHLYNIKVTGPKYAPPSNAMLEAAGYFKKKRK